MHIQRKALEKAGLIVDCNEEFLVIQGTNEVSMRTKKACTTIGDELEFSDREVDELLDHVVNVSVWSTLKRLSN